MSVIHLQAAALAAKIREELAKLGIRYESHPEALARAGKTVEGGGVASLENELQGPPPVSGDSRSAA